MYSSTCCFKYRTVVTLDIYRTTQKKLQGLMDVAARFLNEWFGVKKFGFTPGIVVTLHTFGSKLEFNPHTHLLVTIAGVKKEEK